MLREICFPVNLLDSSDASSISDELRKAVANATIKKFDPEKWKWVEFGLYRVLEPPSGEVSNSRR